MRKEQQMEELFLRLHLRDVLGRLTGLSDPVHHSANGNRQTQSDSCSQALLTLKSPTEITARRSFFLSEIMPEHLANCQYRVNVGQ